MTETATESVTTTATKTAKTKAPKSSGKAKAATPKTAPAKAAKPKKEKAPREDRQGWGTFALRLPVAERDAFHQAAGPAGASRSARAVLVAFANEDEAAFRDAIKAARELR